MKRKKGMIITVLAILTIGILVSGCPRWWHKHPHHPHRLTETAR